MDLFKVMAGRIPAAIRKTILEEAFIDKAINTDVVGTPMEYLFDVYAEFIDAIGEFDNWTCFKCREHVLTDFRKLKSYLIELQNDK